MYAVYIVVKYITGVVLSLGKAGMYPITLLSAGETRL